MTTTPTPEWAKEAIEELKGESLSLQQAYIDAGDESLSAMLCCVREADQLEAEGRPSSDFSAVHILRVYGDSLCLKFATHEDALIAYQALTKALDCTDYSPTIADSQTARGQAINESEGFIHQVGLELSQARDAYLQKRGDEEMQRMLSASTRWQLEQEAWLLLVWGMSAEKAHATVASFVALNEQFKQWEERRRPGVPPSVLSLYNRE